MSLYGGIRLCGRPDLENVRRLDLLPMRSTMEMMRYGMALDIPHLEALTDTLTREINELRYEICSYIPHEKLDEFIEKSNMDAEDDYLPMNVESTKQMRKLLFEVLEVGKTRDLKLTKSGDISTGKRQMESVKKDHHVVRPVLKYRELSKLKGTYTVKLPRIARFHNHGECKVCGLLHDAPTMRVHTEIMWTRTSTSRAASKNPNLQNIPARSKYGKETRKAFVASPGKVIVGVDFSQLQLRILADRARESRMIWIFENNKDPHTMTAAWTFDVPETEVIKEQRDPAKNVNFALCLAEGQRVLTDRGLIPIQDVLCCDRVWDGVEWVHHDGVIYKGRRKVITYDGLTATQDHEIWTRDGRKIQLGEAMAEGSLLAVTGGADGAIQFEPAGDVKVDLLQGRQKVPVRRSKLPAMREASGNQHRHNSIWTEPGLHLRTEDTTRQRMRRYALTTIHRYCSALYVSAVRGISRLRRTWDSEPFSGRAVFCGLCPSAPSTFKLQRNGHWPDQQRGSLRAGEHQVGDTVSESSQHTTDPVCSVQWRASRRNRFVLQIKSRSFGLPLNERPDNPACVLGSTMAGDFETPSQEVPVYDLLNAGPRRRFTCEGKLVSNCFGETPRGLLEQLVSDSYGKNDLDVPDWLTLQWCENFFRKWHGIYTDVEPYMETQYYRARRYGCTWDMFGGFRRIPEVRSVHRRKVAEGLRQAGNNPIQAPDGGMMKLAMAEVQDKIVVPLRAEGIWCQPLMTIHDELLVETDEAYGQLVKDMMVSLFENVMVDKETNQNVLRVPIRASGAIMRRWEK